MLLRSRTDEGRTIRPQLQDTRDHSDWPSASYRGEHLYQVIGSVRFSAASFKPAGPSAPSTPHFAKTPRPEERLKTGPRSRRTRASSWHIRHRPVRAREAHHRSALSRGCQEEAVLPSPQRRHYSPVPPASPISRVAPRAQPRTAVHPHLLHPDRKETAYPDAAGPLNVCTSAPASSRRAHSPGREPPRSGRGVSAALPYRVTLYSSASRVENLTGVRFGRPADFTTTAKPAPPDPSSRYRTTVIRCVSTKSSPCTRRK